MPRSQTKNIQVKSAFNILELIGNLINRHIFINAELIEIVDEDNMPKNTHKPSS